MPPNATFAAPIGTPISVPTPIPTLGPGQYFEEENKPDVSLIEGGDEQFGYGPLNDNPSLYAMWVTDEDGTHYFVVPKGDDSLLGDKDPLTDQRLKNGFNQFIEDRDKTVTDMRSKRDDIHAHQRSREITFYTVSAIVGFVAGFCIVVTLGVCGAAVAIGAPIAIKVGSEGFVDNAERESDIDRLSTLEDSLVKEEARLQGKFEVARASVSSA